MAERSELSRILRAGRWGLAGMACVALSGCGDWTDAATRLANDLVAGERQLGSQSGSTHTVQHATPSKAGECEGPYLVQVDKVGAIIIWCRDNQGTTVSSHSTSSHGRAVDTEQTHILDKPARSTLSIDLERRGGRAVITGVR